MATVPVPPPLDDFGPFRAAQSGGGCGNDSPCVEVAKGPDGWRAVRDSKLGDDSPVLTFDAAEWRVFAAGLRAGEFD
ncbi:DUF397 domain-containing protein [Kribbella sp. NBC_00709]|uniref:DUF397 domain-containing protein n=1 Tax=Kribbella sp. NBC_00709 TaxID=2975972 RepID=UPI002E2934DD|nr:DUF397 domain-containing protein [Kribbella sp. NBC_00709]